MTSKLTREQLHERARENVKALKMASRQTAFESVREEILADLQLAELALAAMDSEPDCKERKLFCSTDTARMRKVISASAGTEDAPLYRHAQPAPVVPEEKPIPNTLSMYAVDAVAAIAEVKGWNACRAAMLEQQLVDRVDEKSLTSINPVPDLVSLQKKVESIIGNYPGIPDGSEHCPCCGKKLRRTCSVEGCGGKHVAHGLCQKHYDMQRWEDPEQVERFREAGRRYRGKKKSTVATPQEPKP